MLEAIDGILVRFLGWFAGTDNDPGVAQRNTARVKAFFYLLVLGFLAPFVTIILAVLVNWISGSVDGARIIMAFGILPGAIVGTIIGLGFAFVVDLIVRVLGNTPEDAGEFVEAYSDVFAWVLVAEELCWLFVPYAPLWAIFIGVVLALTIIHMVIGWNLPITWSRKIAFQFQMLLLVTIIAVSAANFYEADYFFAHAEESVVKHARSVAAEKAKAIRTAELASITARIVDPRSSVVYQEAARRGFTDKADESAFAAKEYQRAHKDMARWEDRGYPRPVRWVRATWRDLIE